jgi:hypothetical protein
VPYFFYQTKGDKMFNPIAVRDQIGMMNVLAISGGRWFYDSTENTVILPVHYGYKVVVKYNAGSDDYTVSRILVRGTKVTVKGERNGVYCEELGEVAYRASCYRDEF